jgi:predicted enzyme related to lactoylglutathione lyase
MYAESQATKGAVMSERNGYPAGVPCWVETSQPDPEAAASFYAGLFGWQFEDVATADAPGPYFIGRLRNKDVAAVAPVAPGGSPTAMWNSYFWVDSADETVGKVSEAGGRVLAEPFDVGDSGRMAVMADPSGAVLSVLQARAHRGAQLVNEPGTWVRNDLNTSNLEGVKPFYRAVFGWETRSVNFGSGEFTWFSLPGYGASLVEHDPELLDRLEKGGAPEGFEEAVSFVTLRNDEIPPHWSVTFAVDDADATADRAADLGGTVVAPPFDAPYVRVTVIQDPQGAVFAASKYSGPG